LLTGFTCGKMSVKIVSCVRCSADTYVALSSSTSVIMVTIIISYY